ncbi:MAG: hypothetical protein Q8P83_00945 [bacterium]|nr:hypothetical protein [bacterium]
MTNKHFFSNLNNKELRVFKKLDTPAKIQTFLNKIPINFERKKETCYSPRMVLKKKKAHCIEGAIFAASVLWHHGAEPLLVDLKTVDDDLDHVLAVFKKDGHWGAITKTNHAVLRYREPIYKNIRELAMSFFHEYYLDDGRKTLRSYTQPFNLKKIKNKNWFTSEKNLWFIPKALDQAKHYPILTRSQIRNLRPVERIEIRAGRLTEWK